MNKTLKVVLIAASVLLVSSGLLIGGILIGRAFSAHSFFARNFGPGMMGFYSDNYRGEYSPGMMWDEDYEGGFGHGMMGNRNFKGSYGPGMMWDENYQGEFNRVHGPGMMWGGDYEGEFGPGMMWDENYEGENCPIHDGDFGPGMMWDEDYSGSFGHGMMGGGNFGGGFGPGMMWQGNYEDEDLPVLSLEQADEALDEFLQSYEDENLSVKEIMIFSNHAYAEIVEVDSGIGAFEVLIDPVTLSVYPEHGPNMMWNLKYGMHGSFGYDEAMTVSPEEATSLAQEYLDDNTDGLQADDHADTFYGYYTLHILQDGEVVGMLSVNGFTGNVFPHTWHGTFVEMSEDAH